jgi:hypothetical protein
LLSNATCTAATLRQQQAKVETVEKFSGLRIKNRLVASMVLEDKFADLRFTRIPDLRHDIPGRWVGLALFWLFTTLLLCVNTHSVDDSQTVHVITNLTPGSDDPRHGPPRACWWRRF